MAEENQLDSTLSIMQGNTLFPSSPLPTGDEAKETPIISDVQAQETKNEDIQTLATLTGTEPENPAQSATEQPERFVKVYKANEFGPGADVSYINAKELGDYTSRGYQEIPFDALAPTTIPKELLDEDKPKTPEELAAEKLKADIAIQERDIEQYNLDLDKRVGQVDIEYQDLVQSIKDSINARKEAMKEINRRSEAIQNTINIRFGTSRYAPGVASDIITAQERAGQQRLDELDAEESRLVAEAMQAKNKEKYSLMHEKVENIKDIRDNKVKELADMQKEALKKKEEIKKTKEKVMNQAKIADIINGIDIPDVLTTSDISELKNAIFDSVNFNEKGELIGNVTMEEIETMIKGLKETEAQTMTEKYGAGIVGEYNFYTEQEQNAGRTPLSFDEYQTRDVNRKAQAISSSGLTTQQTSTFLNISNKYQADEIIKTGLRGISAIAIANQIIANPGSAGNQLKALYTLVKNLDPDSAVREGELALASQTQSYFGKFATSISRIAEGKLLSEDATIELANATKELAEVWFDAAKRRDQQYVSQAGVAGVGDAFNQYLEGFNRPTDTTENGGMNEFEE